MTSPGRYSGRLRDLPPQIRVIGTRGEVEAIVERLGQVLDVTRASRRLPRRDEPGRVAIHLEIRIRQEEG